MVVASFETNTEQQEPLTLITEGRKWSSTPIRPHVACLNFQPAVQLKVSEGTENPSLRVEKWMSMHVDAPLGITAGDEHGRLWHFDFTK